MSHNLIEGLRVKSVNRLFDMKTFESCWPVWKSEIATFTKDLSDYNAIYDLGSKLREVFAATASGSRSQGEVSGGGAAWEGLVCWYLNLVLTDTLGVVIKQNKSLMPRPLADAMTVTYRNRPTNTESDLSGIVFPNLGEALSQDYSSEKCDEIIEQHLNLVSLHNIQCKTNWNDNAQIPMLWDMIYQFRGVKHQNVTIGTNGKALDDLADFTYSFVTMPSQKGEFKAGSMPTQRVESLSGGNFWGQHSQAGVAMSLSEIFKRVFGHAFDGHIQAHIRNLVENGRISLGNGD